MKVLPLLLLLVTLSGCLSPAKEAQKAVAKTAALQHRQDGLEDRVAAKGKALVYGTGVALEAAPASPEVSVARDLNRKAGVVLGQPSEDDAVRLESIVHDALSGVSSKQTAADARLAQFTGEISSLQKQIAGVQLKVEKSETAKDELLLRDSALAQTWVGLKRGVYWVVAGIMFLFLLPSLLRVAALLIPAMGPLAGPASSLVARMVSHVVERVPDVAQKAGVVAKDAFNTTEAAASHAVDALERLKDNPAVREEVKRVLKQAQALPLEVEQEIARLRAS